MVTTDLLTRTRKLHPPARMLKLALLGLAVFSLLSYASSAYAVDYGGLGGTPANPDPDNPRTESIYVYDLEPGGSKEDGVLVINNTDDVKTILVYPTDSLVSSGGSFGCRQYAEPKEDVGTWITLDQEEITLDPTTNQVIDFTVDVPDTASVGEYNGCIVIQEKKEDTVDSGMSLSFRTAIRMAITIPGELDRSLEIDDFSVSLGDNDLYILSPAVRNLGNVSIDANIIVKSKNLFGQTFYEGGGEYPILRGQRSDWNFSHDKPFWGGPYQAKLTVEYDESADASVGIQSGGNLTSLESDTVWFFVMPAPAALAVEAAILLLIIGTITMIIIHKKRARNIEKTWVEYTVEANENITSLGKKFSTSWKLIARTNQLKAPYIIKAGDTLKVPPSSDEQPKDEDEPVEQSKDNAEEQSTD